MAKVICRNLKTNAIHIIKDRITVNAASALLKALNSGSQGACVYWIEP